MLREEGIGKGGMKGGFIMGRLALSKGPARMGIGYYRQKADIPSKGFFHTIDTYALNITNITIILFLITTEAAESR